MVKLAASSHSRQRLVVGCDPVPNARPGFKITWMYLSSFIVEWSGHIRNLFPIFIGTQDFCHSLCQFFWVIFVIFFFGNIFKFNSWSNLLSRWARSLLPLKRQEIWIFFQIGISPGRGSNICSFPLPLIVMDITPWRYKFSSMISICFSSVSNSNW